MKTEGTASPEALGWVLQGELLKEGRYEKGGVAGNLTGEGTGDERGMQADMHGLLDHQKEFRLSILSAIGRQAMKSFKQGSDMNIYLKAHSYL